MAETTFDLKESNAESLVATCIVMLIMSWIAVGLRTYTRIALMKSCQADDILMLVAQALFTVTCSIQFEGVNYGVGRHDAAISDDDDKVAAIKWQALGVANYILNMMFVKLSIGLFLLRIATKKPYIWVIRTVLIVIALWSIGLFTWDIFQCSPIAKQWDYRLTDGNCAGADEVLTAAYALSVMTVVTDWFFALIPIPMLWEVKMTMQAKVTVFAILGLGIFASIATLIRIKFLTSIENTDDILFRPTNASIWSLVEVGVAITASSLATVRPLMRSFQIRGFTSVEQSLGLDISGPGRYRSKSHKGPEPTMPDISVYDVCLRGVTARGDDDDDAVRTGKKRAGLAVDDYHHSIKQIDHKGGPRPDAKSRIYTAADGSLSPSLSTQNLGPTERSMDHAHRRFESHGRAF
ncbi:hypothetical protein E4U42_003721 [Claviceps africana]|uniref:Rhodopsin domain-containing protein n=1 Tax=Claviceps africana TaxID=83212 RepID=A0A8K0J6L7_9HYPO|nr:hypothetical protein E4U42_003721 [Claviceps africana]